MMTRNCLSRLYLTKTLFRLACECPRKLELRYQLLKTNGRASICGRCSDSYCHQCSSLGAAYSGVEEGRIVGAYARWLFPNGIEIENHSQDGLVDTKGNEDEERKKIFLSADQAVARTKELLEQPTPMTLFEAAIQYNHLYIRADILHKDQDNKTLHLMEVKAKSWDSSASAGGGTDPNQDSSSLFLTNNKLKIRAEYHDILLDVAFQKHVLSKAFPEYTIKASLILPDKSKINCDIPNLYGLLASNQNPQPFISEEHVSNQHTPEASLLAIVNVDDILTKSDLLLENIPGLQQQQGQQQINIPKTLPEWIEILENKLTSLQGTMPGESFSSSSSSLPPVGNQCRECCECFVETCWKELTEDPTTTIRRKVFQLYGGGSKVTKLIQDQQYDLSKLQPTHLGLDDDGYDPKRKMGKKSQGITRSERQWLQVQYDDDEINNTDKGNFVIMDKEYFRQNVLQQPWFQYPLHFVDFETVTPAIPYHIGKRPYDALAFQFSHHVLSEEHGTVHHATEFLETTDYPNVLFLEALAETFTRQSYDHGTIFRWGAHENTILSSLIQSEGSSIGPSTLRVLQSLISHTKEKIRGERAMVDLMFIVSNCYYARGSQGSSSIKQVLLPTMQASKLLRELYSPPNYSSSNYTNFQWWVPHEQNKEQPVDPYSLLSSLSSSLHYNDTTNDPSDSSTSLSVAHGGDAIAVYHTIQQQQHYHQVQNGDSSNLQSHPLEKLLKRYCELDTLAMAMMMQALQDFSADDDLPAFATLYQSTR